MLKARGWTLSDSSKEGGSFDQLTYQSFFLHYVDGKKEKPDPMSTLLGS